MRYPARRRLGYSMLAAVAIGTLGWPVAGALRPRIVYNASDSVPRGWYRISVPNRLQVGDLVLARLPTTISVEAASRGYLARRTPILKPIRAVSSQQVCVQDRDIIIDRSIVARALQADAAGRPMGLWAHCRRLVGDELFLLSTTHPASFDSRYFGPIHASRVIGVAHPLWTWREQP